ncbi:MAG TPA: AAA family ATPase [Candidatus Baltobacteraceae bacterium]|jgi:predicted ATPase|nr:AAA family ATPase [Candidatus Baltobacteraceae bacterium]
MPEGTNSEIRGIRHIAVRGYKSIKSLDLPLGALNVLIGANGAGKSNFISVFRLLNELSEQNLQGFVARSGGANALLHYGRKTTKEIHIKLDSSKIGYETYLDPDAHDGFNFRKEAAIVYVEGDDLSPYRTFLGTGQRESLLPLVDPLTSSNVINMLNSLKIYHFHDTSPSASMKQTGDINDNATLRADASNLAAFLYRFQKNNEIYYRKIIDTIGLVAPFFRDFNLRADPLNPEKIRLEWRERASDAYFNAHALSDGTLRFICLATLLLQPDPPATILIDEPELGLHPSAIQTLVELFRLASEKSQLIVSTQSVSLVNQLTPEEIIVVDRAEDQSLFRRLQSNEITTWLEDYALGDLWEKNVIGGRP